jgi:endoglucanase
MAAVGELQFALDAIRWATDYHLKSFVAPTLLYAGVGDGQSDHAW